MFVKKESLCQKILLPVSDVIARDRNESIDWKIKSPFYSCSDNNIGFGSLSQEGIGNMGFFDLGVQESMRKSVSNGSRIKDALGNKLSDVRMFENSYWEEEEEEYIFKISSSVMKFTCEDSSLIDLKLGGFIVYLPGSSKYLFDGFIL